MSKSLCFYLFIHLFMCSFIFSRMVSTGYTWPLKKVTSKWSWNYYTLALCWKPPPRYLLLFLFISLLSSLNMNYINYLTQTCITPLPTPVIANTYLTVCQLCMLTGFWIQLLDIVHWLCVCVCLCWTAVLVVTCRFSRSTLKWLMTFSTLSVTVEQLMDLHKILIISGFLIKSF